MQELTQPELAFFREHCNFVNQEKELFELRASGLTLEECCEHMHMEISGVKYISRKVNAKMIKVVNVADMKKWMRERYG